MVRDARREFRLDAPWRGDTHDSVGLASWRARIAWLRFGMAGWLSGWFGIRRQAMSAYYNEHDPYPAQWLRNLIAKGLIADGTVDERSIVDVRPDDLRGFQQCHFFAGIGGWSYALRLAGWSDDRPVWTGSCPCQPFSSAGAQAGGHDPRDLWPVWFQLIRECRPGVVFGEQVEAAIGHGWLDRLCDDLEREGYAIGAVGLPGACVGAFDIRQRLWFVADANGGHAEHRAVQRGREHGLRAEDRRADADERVSEWAEAGIVADAAGERRIGERLLLRAEATGRIARDFLEAARRSEAGELADADRDGLSHIVDGIADRTCGAAAARTTEGGSEQVSYYGRANFWADAEWISCRDGKWRPVEPGTFPLAHGIPNRVGRLRAYGNAIKPQVAAEVIRAYLDVAGGVSECS
jgi:DNA (cytosine-5)-methyltransferase 1